MATQPTPPTKKQASQLPGPSTDWMFITFLHDERCEHSIPYLSSHHYKGSLYVIKPCILKGHHPPQITMTCAAFFGCLEFTDPIEYDRATCAPSLHRPRDFPLQAWSRNPRENVDSLVMGVLRVPGGDSPNLPKRNPQSSQTESPISPNGIPNLPYNLGWRWPANILHDWYKVFQIGGENGFLGRNQ